MKKHKVWYLTQQKWGEMRKEVFNNVNDSKNETEEKIVNDILCHGCDKLFNIPFYGTKFELCPDCAINYQKWYVNNRIGKKYKLTREKWTEHNVKLFLSEILDKRYDVSLYE